MYFFFVFVIFVDAFKKLFTLFYTKTFCLSTDILKINDVLLNVFITKNELFQHFVTKQKSVN